MTMPDFSWAKDMKESSKITDRDLKEVQAIEALGETPMDVIDFERTERKLYNAEAATKGKDLIFHFFPKQPRLWPVGVYSQKLFEDVMGDAFIEVFKFPEKLQAAYSEEIDSWAVKAVGYGENLAVDSLVAQLYEVLDRRLTE